MEDIENKESVIIQDDNAYNKKIKSIPKPEPEIGIEHNDIIDTIAEKGIKSTIDLNSLDTFQQAATNRNQLYQILDLMAQDSTIAAILETYAEDATEYNEKGQIVWATSEDANISKFVNILLQNMQVDKNVYNWVYSLIHYGDLYLQLFKQSEQQDDVFNKKKPLNEDVKIVDYKESDHYISYIEAVLNPAKMFELTRFGKTSGFIEAENVTNPYINTNTANSLYSNLSLYKYNIKSNDVKLYGNDKFVHACLDNTNTRAEEEVKLFRDEDDKEGITYKVKKGQSLLYNVFKIWRELALLENSILLNRVTKSSIVRLINVEVGDMAKENVGPHLQGIKSLMEQKSALDVNNSMTEYTNPGPIENNIYVPTYNGKGAITTTQVGGDVNVGQLPDVDYFQNKFFGAMRIPKQYFGLTEDGAGFNGGQSLSIISSRYAKAVKKIQNCIIQALTTVVNLMLIDRKMISYVNKFSLHMQAPTTQEEIDRRENESARIQIIQDIMNLVSDIEDNATKLKILKNLMSEAITDSEVIDLLQSEIDKIESEGLDEEITPEEDIDISVDEKEPLNLDKELGLEPSPSSAEIETEIEETLPTPEETGEDLIDFGSEE